MEGIEQSVIDEDEARPGLGRRALSRAHAEAVLLHALFHDVPLRVYAGSLGLQAVFAILPLLACTVAVLALVGVDHWMRAGIENASTFLPASSIDLLQQQERALLDTMRRDGLIGAAIISALVAVWRISGCVSSLGHALNAVHGVREQRSFWHRRLAQAGLASCGLVLPATALGLLMFSLPLAQGLGIEGSAWRLLLVLGAWVLLQFTIVVCYRVAPSESWPMRDLWPGATLAGALWLMFAAAFSWYVARWLNTDAFGTLASMFVTLLWLQGTAFALLLGAVWNHYRHTKRLAGTQGQTAGELGAGDEAAGEIA